MPYILITRSPGQGLKEYQAVEDELGPEQPAGNIASLAGETADGVLITADVWESSVAADRFAAEQLSRRSAAWAWHRVPTFRHGRSRVRRSRRRSRRCPADSLSRPRDLIAWPATVIPPSRLAHQVSPCRRRLLTQSRR